MATIESNFESICINPNDDLVLYKKEIIRSRIEKFLYAICSLDTDDLPTPLSRIEELYNCLVTGGDIPTFTPLSRAEKFVMAMLGAYDVELLPTPISRSETLMKKIAIGDNNLDDIDNLQSRYEFLLAYIIKAGGFNGGSGDFYYNLTSLTSSFTTIYGTLDKPVKNAVLRGSTLVNLVGTYKHTISTVNKPIVWGQKRLFLTNIKPNTRYTLRVKITEIVKGNYGPRVQIFFTTYSTGEINTTTSTSDTLIFTSPAELSSDAHLRLIVTGSEAEATEVDFEVLLLEGEHPDIKDIPFFDDMSSVKMPVLKTVGKNLCDEVFELGTLTDGVDIDTPLNKYTRRSVNYYDIKGAQTLTLSGTIRMFGDTTAIIFYNLNKEYISTVELVGTGGTTSVPKNAHFAKIRFGDTNTTLNVQLEESSVATEYEPHKSTTVSCNEEVELRGIGDIKDELNLVTGELTQRIQERVLDGSKNWIIGGTGTNYIKFRCESYTDMVKSSDAITCDRYAYNKENNATSNLNVANSTTTGKICIVTSQTDLSIDNFKAKLNTDKPTIQYQLAEPIVKTVDLSILNQDNKETKLTTFDDITHVIASSEGLVPTGDIDIARPIQFVDYSLDNSLTTLYNTLEYPVKNAVLRGQTLVNIIKKPTDENIGANKDWSTQGSGIVRYSYDANKGVKVVNSVDGSMVLDYLDLTLFKPNTEYTLFIDVTWSGVGRAPMLMEITNQAIDLNNGLNIVKFTSVPDLTIPYMCFRLGYTGTVKVGCEYTFNNIMVIEGDYTNTDIPYFEGMASVKMPVLTTVGKNLFDVSRHGSLTPQPTGDIQLNSAEWGKYDVKYILKPNTQYTLTILGDGTKCWMAISVDGSSQSSNVEKSYTKTFSTNSNGEVTIGIYANSDKYVGYSRKSISIEEGTVSTPYEPFKSNILTCNEEVTLRGIGDIKDELNLVTGELTQRVGSTLLKDGYWTLNGTRSQPSVRFSYSKRVLTGANTPNRSLMADKIPTLPLDASYEKESYGIGGLHEDILYLYIPRSLIGLDINDNDIISANEKIKAYMDNLGEVRVQYELAEPIVKTVDLSTVDQDDVLLISENGDYIITENGDYINISTQSKKTKLKTFDDITHVTVSSEGLIPTGEITVATKNATDVADASVMSLRMDDILNSQETLEGSANTQSDDIDVAMLGTTDIYEQLL